MIALDTKVLVRFLVRDDAAQFERAQRLIRRESNAGESVFISLLVLLETEWVLRSRYKLAKAEILDTFDALLRAIDLNFEDEATIERALFFWKDSPAQFADRLIGAHHHELGCNATATFDSDAAKLPDFVAA